MGKIIHLKKIKEFIDNNIVFSVNDIKRILILNKANLNYAYLVLHNLIEKGLIYRIIKSYYSKYSDPTIITYCIKPSYIGLEAALSLHNLWEQETNVVLLTPRRIRTGLRKIFNTNVIIYNINKKYFFGFDYFDYYNFKIPISDIEKTFIDLVFYNKHIDKNLLKKLRNKSKKNKINQYLKHYNKRFVKKFKKYYKKI